MDTSHITQDELAKKLGVTKGRVSQWINRPGNISLGKMIEYAQALGMKVSVIAYQDDDPENKKGPIDSEIFKICWEQLGKPRDFWDVQAIANTSTGATTYLFEAKYHLATTPIVHTANIAGRIYDATLFPEWEVISGNVACPVYFQVKQYAGNNAPNILNKEIRLPS